MTLGSRITSATLVLLLLNAGGASAGIVRSFEFDNDGVLPSSEPDISLFNNTGAAESSLYSVSGGFLRQRTYSVVGNASYLYPNFNVNGAFDPAEDFSMEARIRVLRINGSLGGVYFNAFDGQHRYALILTPTGGGYVLTSTGVSSFGVDVTQFHTYRLESPGNSSTLRVYVDGALVSTVVAPVAGGWNHFGFGDGHSTAGIGADADWDYVRINTAVSSVPEPATLPLAAGAAALGLTLLRRRARR